MTAVLSRTASLPPRPVSRGLPSPNVVLRWLAVLTTGAVRGLRMLAFTSFSLSLLTMRRACDAVNIFSFGGLPAEVPVGLRRR